MSARPLRWFAFARVDDKAGASTALAGVFSARGVSVGSISTLDVHGGRGVLSMEFTASARLAHVLVRTLERLTVVREVTLVAADDPLVRAVAVFEGDQSESAHAGVSSWFNGSLTLITGPFAAVSAAVASLRDAGRAPLAVTTLPPQSPVAP